MSNCCTPFSDPGSLKDALNGVQQLDMHVEVGTCMPRTSERAEGLAEVVPVACVSQSYKSGYSCRLVAPVVFKPWSNTGAWEAHDAF